MKLPPCQNYLTKFFFLGFNIWTFNYWTNYITYSIVWIVKVRESSGNRFRHRPEKGDIVNASGKSGYLISNLTLNVWDQRSLMYSDRSYFEVELNFEIPACLPPVVSNIALLVMTWGTRSLKPELCSMTDENAMISRSKSSHCFVMAERLDTI